MRKWFWLKSTNFRVITNGIIGNNIVASGLLQKRSKLVFQICHTLQWGCFGSHSLVLVCFMAVNQPWNIMVETQVCFLFQLLLVPLWMEPVFWLLLLFCRPRLPNSRWYFSEFVTVWLDRWRVDWKPAIHLTLFCPDNLEFVYSVINSYYFCPSFSWVQSAADL